MAERPGSDRPGAEPDRSSDETAVSGRVEPFRSFREVNTGMMVFELQGAVGQLRHAVSSIEARLAKSEARGEGIERATGQIRDLLEKLAPRIEDISGFIKHGAPNLANKTDVAALRSEIEKRPTRRQAVLDLAWIVGIIISAVTFGARALH
jgi:hypothetical protein